MTARRAAAWGIEPGYRAIGGGWVPTSPATEAAILEAMGARDESPGEAPALVVTSGHTRSIGTGPHQVELEEGGTVRCNDALPRDLPLGYHTLRRLGDGCPRRLIVTPAGCHLPSRLRGWAVAAQLYSVRSERSWGIGDLQDLRSLAAWVKERGGTTVLLNPLHAATPGVPQQPSPYYPSSRVFRNPLYLAVERVPGAAALGEELDGLARAGRALNRERHLDRDRVFRLKDSALRALFRAWPGDPTFDEWRAREGAPLESFASYCALVQDHGRRWAEWPADLRHPRSEGVRRFAERNAAEVRYHAWLQWLLERQLREAAEVLPPIMDLAVGADPEGADAWVWQDVLALGTSVGAPPDPFAAEGQNWAVPPFDPWRLRDAGYEPFVRLVRAGLRHAFGIRLDHVMGLFRLYWIPPGAGGAEGAYVRYPAEDLLGIVALESRRAGGIVVGEDLGTVEPGVRTTLRRRRVLSYRLLYFERKPPDRYPKDAFCAVTTHDLPTLTGLWERPQVAPEAHANVVRATGLDVGTGPAEAVVAAARALAASPSRLASATLEDMALEGEQPNHPGTTSPENWSRALPLTLEQLQASPHAQRVIAALRRS